MIYRVIDNRTGEVLEPERDQVYTADDLAPHAERGLWVVAQVRRQGWECYLWNMPTGVEWSPEK